MNEEIVKLLKDTINPALSQHKGSAELVEVKDGIAYLKFHGSCSGCPGKKNTLRNGIKPFLQANVEGLVDIQIVD